MQKLVPITRLGKFFGGEDYALDIGMGEEWLLGDMNFTVILYRIDRYKLKKMMFMVRYWKMGFNSWHLLNLRDWFKLWRHKTNFLVIQELNNKSQEI
jgi:hypothetical protein